MLLLNFLVVPTVWLRVTRLQKAEVSTKGLSLFYFLPFKVEQYAKLINGKPTYFKFWAVMNTFTEEEKIDFFSEL